MKELAEMFCKEHGALRCDACGEIKFLQEEIEKRDRLLGEAKEIIKLANYNYHFSKDHIYEIEKRSTNEWLKQYEEMRLK